MPGNTKLRRCGELLITFLKIGAFTFGGGYAMIPLIQKETVEKKHWISDHDILDIVAVAESTPGPIAINSATFVGHQTAGFWGAVCATTGVVLPSFLIILILSAFLRQFEELKLVRYAFTGIRAGVLALIIKALFSMGRQCPKNVLAWCIIAGSFGAAAILGWNVLMIIICCAAVGIASAFLPRKEAD
jgi:chromate transporter